MTDEQPRPDEAARAEDPAPAAETTRDPAIASETVAYTPVPERRPEWESPAWDAPAPAGHYAQGIVHGGLVYVAGQLG